MTYKAIVKCFSGKNTMAEYKNFGLYIDSISYPNTGRYFETENSLKSGCHTYALVKGSANEEICSYFNVVLPDIEEKKKKEEIVEQLENVMNGALSLAKSKNAGAHSAVIIYIENSNVYAAGFGDAGVYVFSDGVKTDGDFVVSGDSACAVHIGSVSQCNEYLLSVSSAIDEMPAEKLGNFFSEDAAKAMDAYDEVCEMEADEHFVAASVSFEKEIKNFNMKMVIAALLIVVFAALGCVTGYIHFRSKNETPGSDKNSAVTQNAESGYEEETEAESNIGNQIEIEELPALSNLEQTLDRIAFEISGENSKVSYYVKNLTTGDFLSKNSSQMYAADMMNMYVIAEFYRQVQSGELSLDDSAGKLLESAATVNDYESANKLIRLVGGNDAASGYRKVTDFSTETGCSATVMKTDITSPDTACDIGGNLTSVEDCALLLERLYNGGLVSSESSEEIYELLGKSSPRTKILKYIPQDGVQAINKAGGCVNAQNDVAVICTDKCDYIICVMINDFANTPDSASEVIARMSKAVYDHLILQKK